MALAFHRFALVLLLSMASLPTACGFIENVNGPDGLAIKKFSVTPTEVAAGSAAMLSWEVEGAESIQVDNGIGVVRAKDTLEVRVSRTTTYALTARAGTSVATATVRLLVGPGRTSS